MRIEQNKRLTTKYKTGIIYLILFTVMDKLRHRLSKEQKDSAKYKELYKLMVQWMEIKQSRQLISKWLNENEYYEIAIYGLYLIGERLYIELLDENVKVMYGIDKKSRDRLEGLRMYKPDDKLPNVDLVIVTAVSNFEEIKRKLHGKINGSVMSLKEILDEVSIY